VVVVVVVTGRTEVADQDNIQCHTSVVTLPNFGLCNIYES